MEKYNTFWLRLIASIIDEIILYPLTLLSSLVLDVDSNILYILGIILFTFIYSGYFIWCHGKFGQTIGKRAMGIKVLNVDEIKLIGLKKALMRESIFILMSVIAILYFLFQLIYSHNKSFTLRTDLDDLISLFSLAWLGVELITMLLNHKRRAVHDFLANSVVLKIKAT